MPELAEVEAYRQLAVRALERRIVEVWAPDDWYLKRGLDAETVTHALLGRKFVAARRIGKLLLLDTDRGRSRRSGPTPVLGLRFGMSGRLVVDGVAGVDGLVYSSNTPDRRFDRFAVRFAGRGGGRSGGQGERGGRGGGEGRGGELVMRDPRRLGAVELDPPEGRLGPDALAVTTAQLRAALSGSASPVKARLMDQARLAGVGNLAADEILWRVGLDPARRAGSLDDGEIRRLAGSIRRTLADLLARGGSHTGDLMDLRRPGGRCPKDDGALIRRTIGGRTTWSCPVHQR